MSDTREGARHADDERTDAAHDAAVRLDTHPDALPATRFSLAVDRALGGAARAASWLWLVLLAVIVANVAMRYVLGSGRIEFEELQWHLYALGLLVGLSAADRVDAHIRVDVLRDRLSPQARAWIELYGLLLLFFPFVALVVVTSLPFVAESFAQGEISPSPGGLPLRWLIKAALPLGFALLGVAGLARLSRVSALLFGTPRPARAGGPTGDGAAGSPEAPRGDA